MINAKIYVFSRSRMNKTIYIENVFINESYRSWCGFVTDIGYLDSLLIISKEGTPALID